MHNTNCYIAIYNYIQWFKAYRRLKQFKLYYQNSVTVVHVGTYVL